MDIFLTTAPGLEEFLAMEAREKGFKVSETIPGGVTLRGEWPDIWRANLQLRGANRVLARLGQFSAVHLSQLDKKAHAFDWGATLPDGAKVFVETSCRKSKIYHAGAATERVENALRANGFQVAADAPFRLKVRIEANLVTISLDTSGESLHKRGHKEAVNKAPMRETMAAMFLRAAGYNGKSPMYDPMCGSGTFPIEAGEIARRLDPGRTRAFAFEELPNFDRTAFADMASPDRPAAFPVFGSDRDQGAVAMSSSNAQRAGVADVAQFECASISDIMPPCEAPGLVITNPPYGARIGNKKPLFALYSSFGEKMLKDFKGWRVALITSDASLAKATGLPWEAPGPIVGHGGLKIRLWQTALL